MDSVRLTVGYDSRESVAYHVFCESVIKNASLPVHFTPLHGPMLEGFNGQRDGTNAFIFSRYLTPYLFNYTGWAIFADGDMVVTRDIKELWDLRVGYEDKAVCVVKHEYKTKHRRKYIGTSLESPNVDYPRKNWSSVILWNCGHPANRLLTPEYVASAPTADLHRFNWLRDEQIGELPSDWNYLVGEYPPGNASLAHYTLGVPGIPHYVDDHVSWHWHTYLVSALQCAGEMPSEMVMRAEDRVGAIR